MEKGFFVYAWDLAEEGPKSLEKIQELGANTVCLASSYHAGKFTRPGPSRKSTFLWMGRSILNRIGNSTEVFSPSGIRSWISMISSEIGRSTTRICDSRPGPSALITVAGIGASGTLCQNAFGDPYIYNLCPANDEVQHYVRALSGLGIDRERGVHYPGDSGIPFWLGYHHEFGFSRWTFGHRPCWRLLLGGYQA